MKKRKTQGLQTIFIAACLGLSFFRCFFWEQERATHRKLHSGFRMSKRKSIKSRNREEAPQPEKKPRSPYSEFSAAERAKIIAEFVTANGRQPSFGEIGRLLGERWKAQAAAKKDRAFLDEVG